MIIATELEGKIHVLQLVGDPVGGIRKHVHSIIEGLDNSLFIQSYAHSVSSVDAKFEIELKKIKSRLECVIPLVIKKRPGLQDLINLYILVKYIRANHVDVVHGHGAKGGLYARIVGLICRIKSVYTPHGGVAHRMFSSIEERLYTFVERILYGCTDCFVFESKYTLAAFQQKVGRSDGCWTVNYNGVSIPAVDHVMDQPALINRCSLSSDSFHVGVFGLLRPQKGQEYAIRAVSQLNNKNKSFCLHIFGDGPDRGRLENLSKLLGVADSVIFHGDVIDVDAYMIRMNVILVPSLFESFGYVAVEAMALSRPVIVSSVGGLTEIVDKDSGIFVTPGDVDDIEKALMYCLNHPDVIKLKSLQGRRRVESEFSLERMVERISVVYKNLINPPVVK